ncbi:MAG: cytochrome c oxidase subunit 3 family protein [Bacteroidales bacterium]|nr:cytochrome c oxidase subunit 3 family protein [Bacteroidales bacterium]
MEQHTQHVDEHYDHIGSKMGMWLFIFTELILFGGLFIVYSVYRFMHPTAFHLAAEELDVAIGTINTVILLISSATIAMSITAMQQRKKKLCLGFMFATIFLGLVFLVNKYFEWKVKFEHGHYPGSDTLHELGHGDTLFYGLYFFMTGLHALHIVVGLIIIGFVVRYVINDKVNPERFALLENGGLYWHLVDVIWIFLFPLFYLIH